MTQKREKFVQLAEARVNKTLKDLQLIGNLSNRSAYEFNETDIKKMFAVLQKAVDGAKGRFSREGDGGTGDFKL